APHQASRRATDAGADLPGHARRVRHTRGSRRLRTVGSDRRALAGGRRPRSQAAQGDLRLFDRRPPAHAARGGHRLDGSHRAARGMKIATFNINNVRRRLPNLLAWLEAAEPDVVCLQELKASDREFPRTAIEKAGYGAVWRGERTWNGVAILARGA